MTDRRDRRLVAVVALMVAFLGASAWVSWERAESNRNRIDGQQAAIDVFAGYMDEAREQGATIPDPSTVIAEIEGADLGDLVGPPGPQGARCTAMHGAARL